MQTTSLIRFFRPPHHPDYPLRKQLMQWAINISGLVSLICLSGVSLASLAILLTAAIFILLILDQVFDIQIHMLNPGFVF